jgi:hypothetical protein
VQAKIDNGNWVDTSEIILPDGIHSYQFRVYDHAGHMTESSVGQIAVDATAPNVEADEEIKLGETVYYALEDNGSGLAISRIVIEDEDEQYKKVVWVENIAGNKLESNILWDGKFPSNTLGTSADKILAGIGEYYITFKISDRAGNETFYTTIVNVNPISYLQVIPEFVLPVSEETSNEPTSQLVNEETTEQSFGGTSTPAQPSETQNLISLTGTATAGTSTNTTTSNILWGAAAMAVIGAATAYALEQQKKREEEEEQSYLQAQQQAEMLNQQEQQRIINQWLEGQAILNAQIEALELRGATPAEIEAILAQASTQGFGASTAQVGAWLANWQAENVEEAIQADMTEGEQYQAYVNSPEYIARQEELAEWQEQQALEAAQEATFNHLLNEHRDQQDSYISPSELAQNSAYNHLMNEHRDTSALDWLINLYSDETIPGQTALERTQHILDMTENGTFVHFANIPKGDSGFDQSFRDSGIWQGSGNQVGHFLTALDLSIWANDPNVSSFVGGIRNQFALSAIIGHEMIGDDVGVFPFVINSNQVINGFYYNLTTFGALNRWFLSGEDDNFDKILNMGPHIFNIKLESFTSGNSIEDLRLSYQGWVAGQQITNGEIETSEDFAKWLEENLK